MARAARRKRAGLPKRVFVTMDPLPQADFERLRLRINDDLAAKRQAR
jgi:hypothetical protein